MVEKQENNNNLVKHGIIGFFDILGYGSLLENNEPEDIYKEFYPILENLEEYFKYNFKVIIKRKEKIIDIKHKFQNLIDDIKWFVISDTILITFNTSKYSKEEMCFSWTIFLAACTMLQIKMFQEGLPLRGVINYGKYIVKNNFFAGRPIIEAYKISKDLDFAACVLTLKAIKIFFKDKNILEQSKGIRLILNPFLNYFVPKKGNKKIRMDTLCAKVVKCEQEEIIF